MIERQKINDRWASIAYHDDERNPIDDIKSWSGSYHAHVNFDDGERLWLHYDASEPTDADRASPPAPAPEPAKTVEYIAAPLPKTDTRGIVQQTAVYRMRKQHLANRIALTVGAWTSGKTAVAGTTFCTSDGGIFLAASSGTTGDHAPQVVDPVAVQFDGAVDWVQQDPRVFITNQSPASLT